MLAGTVVNAVHVAVPLLLLPVPLLDEPPLLLLPVVPDELLPFPPDELPLPVPPELPPLPPASGKLVDELLEQPTRPAVNEIVESAMSPKT
jgi:hypothetical protein